MSSLKSDQPDAKRLVEQLRVTVVVVPHRVEVERGRGSPDGRSPSSSGRAGTRSSNAGVGLDRRAVGPKPTGMSIDGLKRVTPPGGAGAAPASARSPSAASGCASSSKRMRTLCGPVFSMLGDRQHHAGEAGRLSPLAEIGRVDHVLGRDRVPSSNSRADRARTRPPTGRPGRGTSCTPGSSTTPARRGSASSACRTWTAAPTVVPSSAIWLTLSKPDALPGIAVRAALGRTQGSHSRSGRSPGRP